MSAADQAVARSDVAPVLEIYRVVRCGQEDKATARLATQGER